MRKLYLACAGLSLSLILGIVGAASAVANQTTVHLGSKGGTATLWEIVEHPKTCTWLSNPKVPGFHTTALKCTTGRVARTAHFAPNSTTQMKRWYLSLVVHYAKSKVGYNMEVVEAGKAIPAAPAPGVTFKCSGNAPSGLSILYGDNGSSYTGPSQVPFKATLSLNNNQQYYFVNAQLNGGGSVNCSTTVKWRSNGVLRSATQSGTAAGGFSIADEEVCNETAFGDGWQAC